MSDAIDLVWGYESADSGENAGAKPVDYTPIFDYVRSQLGYPIVPVELTNEQLTGCLTEAVTEYNRWRNHSENLVYTTLYGNSVDGYEVPEVVGPPDNITDIIFRPKFPFGYYNADPDLANSLYMQYMFQKWGRPGQSGFLSDYALALSTEKDMNLILGTEVRWQIINRRIHISPKPNNAINIGIKYKSALSIDEIMIDNMVKRYTLAKAKILLGNIRSTFGGTIPGGTENIQLNGSDLIAQGKEELNEVKQDMIHQAEPLELLIG